MTKKDSNQPRNRFDEEKIDVEFVKKFIQEMLGDKENFTSQNPKIAKILKSMPAKLQAYLQELQALEKEKKLDDEINKTQQKPSEKRQKIQDRIEKITNEIFIISCASNNSLEKSLKFHEKCGLDKEFSKFGECGLSPLMAAMLSGKSTQDLQTLLNLGARINEKNAYGFTVLDFAEIVGIGSEVTGFLKENGARSLNSDQQKEEGLQREREREEKLERDLEKSQKRDLERERMAQREEVQRERFEQEQIMIARSMMALELYEELIEARRQEEIAAREKQENGQEFPLKAVVENFERDVEPLKVEVELVQEKVRDPSESSFEILEQERKISSDLETQIDPFQIPEFDDESGSSEDEKPQIQENKTAIELEIERILDVDIDKVNINELLFNSVKDGQPMLAVLLMHCGADVNYRQGDKSVLDMAIEKGNSSLIAVLSKFSAPDTVSYAFLKVVNNGNYTSQTVGALVGERLEYKKDMPRDEFLPDVRREMQMRQKEVFSDLKESVIPRESDASLKETVKIPRKENVLRDEVLPDVRPEMQMRQKEVFSDLKESVISRESVVPTEKTVKISMSRDDIEIGRESSAKQKEFSFVKETRASKTTDDIVERGSKKEAPSGRIHSTEAFSVIGGKIAAQKESFSDKVTSQREVSGSQNTTIVSH